MLCTVRPVLHERVLPFRNSNFAAKKTGSTMRVPGYNSPQRMTFFYRWLVWIIVVLCIASAQALSSWDSPSADFAKQIAALSGPGTVTLTVSNRSDLSNDEVAAIRRAIERELRSAGLTVRTKDADSDIHITLSQNRQGWLWVAEVEEGSETKVAMLPVPGSTPGVSGPSEPTITLHASLIHSQVDPILDLTMLGTGNDQHMFVLEPEHIRVYARAAGNWQVVKNYEISHDQPFPRDMRGRIIPAGDHLFDAYLPGVACTATKTGDNWDMTLSCSDSDDPWPLASQKMFYNSTRNFFTGVITPGFGPKLPLFYSGAEITRPGSTAFLFMDVGGAVHMIEDNSHKMLIGARDWGSDFAMVRSGCGQGMQVLASAAGWPASDSIRAYEISGREATPVSPGFSFDGVITAVWASDDGASATVVVKKPQESGYEAYSVSVVCGS